ncbi:MAG: lactate utilization protein [Gemmatimonadota bacterium]|nr:MAG: lactate utilization protein [Gemmatimonadota bacterium]
MSARPAMARDRILERLRSLLREKRPPFRDPIAHDLPAPPMTVYPPSGRRSLVETFGAKLTELSGSCELVRSETDVAERIAQKICEWVPTGGPERTEVLSWAPGELHVARLEQTLAELDVSLFVPDDMNDQRVRDHAASLAVGITGVEAAFANTGSIALLPAPGRSRAASLLPLHHLVLIPLSRLYPTFEDWLLKLRKRGRLEAMVRRSGQIAFITGPSKSADIELNLTLGVHGPKVVHAVVFDDE